MMTRKDFEAFAEMLASHANELGSPAYVDGYEEARKDIGRSIAAVLRASNPRFDATRFYKAARL